MSELVSPFSNPENAEWAVAATRGELLIKHCRSCGENHYYPRAFCPFCQSADTEFLATSGEGEIYSFAITRVLNPVIVHAYVTLQEGPTIMTKIVGVDPDRIAIGQQVRLGFEPSKMGFPMPVFTPVETAQA
ncbi:protein of unknown function DUF35 [Sphingobium chlorophenolicum L-1]|uniref:DUF35 domain-containing protein n=2 Tax=Sphingobium chlorophenolicum TaxID=46429 RepID=F6F1Q0_SPHCR|nr:OB-fold domain-containing protein [Sphingobium chlorophenolicum]AEG51466.1 protein of unknown function DUF35 [Sphingobium chlorophenolicum L-1]KEQ53570.1 hypothetical protein BV95_02151 [Sphingobium chlorophenolicum]